MFSSGDSDDLKATAQLAKDSIRCWVPPGQPVTIQRKQIPGGMLYVGQELVSASGHRGVEPALIVPKLPVAGPPDRKGETMPYWPSYSTIQPQARAAFLEWLAGGRQDPHAAIGYVFLFLYGLERRVLLDARHDRKAREEIPAIATEVKRLLSIYGRNRSFAGYAGSFLAILEAPVDHAAIRSGSYEGGDDWFVPPPGLQRQVAQEVAKHGALGPVLAARLVLENPSISLRTPARRCRQEFSTIFLNEFRRKWPQGLPVPMGRKSVAMSYRPATASIAGVLKIPVRGLPQPTDGWRFVHDILLPLANDCSDQIASYSRWVGKGKPDTALAAQALLPGVCLQLSKNPQVVKLRQTLESVKSDGVALVPASTILEGWDEGAGDLSKRVARDLAVVVERLGFGMEPDVRYGNPKPSKDGVVAVYSQPASVDEDEDLQGAMLLQHLAVGVAAADGNPSDTELAAVTRHFESSVAPAAARRLAAHRAWLAKEQPTLAGVKKRVQALPTAAREAIARHLAAVALADGVLEADEVRFLKKAYPILGLDPELVHSHIHTLSIDTNTPSRDGGPVAIMEADAQQVGIPVPPLPTEVAPQPQVPSLQLDLNKVKAQLEESAEVQSFLHELFDDDDAIDGQATGPKVAPTAAPTALYDLLEVLSEREQWSREELEQTGQDLGLMLDGAIEQVNGLAIEKIGEPVIEIEGEDIFVEPALLKELMT